MTPIEILQFVYVNYTWYWRSERAYKTRDFLSDISKRTLNDATVTKALTGAKRSSKIESALNRESVRKKIEDSLGLPQLFACGSISEIVELAKLRITSKPIWKFQPRETCRDLSTQTSPNPFGLCAPELAATRLLAQQVRQSQRHAVVWQASYGIGATFVALNLQFDAHFAEHFERVFLLRPSDANDPFAKELRTVATQLGVDPNSPDPEDALLSAMRSSRSLLVLADAAFIPGGDEWPYGESYFVRRLIEAACREELDPPAAAAILLIGKPPHFETKTTIPDIGAAIEKSLMIPPGDRYPFFKDRWRAYCRLRGRDPAGEADARVKRANWHYEALHDAPVWPINVRLRAFFASNPDNHAVYDPTAGFEKLVGSGIELPTDIQLFSDDIDAFLDNIPNGVRGAEFRILGNISTAKYWLTKEAADHLREPSSAPDYVAGELLWSEAQIKKLMPPIISRKDPERFFTSIGVKAKIQDIWRRGEKAGERALAHHRVAVRLYDSQNDKALLRHEFPYEPHWGRTRMFFLAESLRHFMRSCDAAEQQDLWVGYDIPGDKLPEPPREKARSADPLEVVNFCFATIYRKELNGHSENTPTRSLNQRHGAYLLAVELLQLMGRKEIVGEPHPALNHRYHGAYIRESGFSLLDIGDLPGASRCFQRLIEHHVEEEDELAVLSAKLDLSIVKTLTGELEEAADLLADVSGAIVRPTATASPVHAIDKLRRRTAGREFALSYHAGHYRECLDLLADYKKSHGKLTDFELIHCEIALWERATNSGLIAMDPKNDHALLLCLETLFHIQSQGLQHESMGFRIALAHLLRRRDRLREAEVICDQVHLEILRYGCSERTFIAFLTEAGRILVEDGRFLRGYSNYLRVCALRCARLGLIRQRDTAVRHALRALKRIRKDFLRLNSPEAWNGRISQARQEQSAYEKHDRPAAFGSFARDPLFGYGIVDIKDVLDELTTFDGIEKHIAEMSAIAPHVATRVRFDNPEVQLEMLLSIDTNLEVPPGSTIS